MRNMVAGLISPVVLLVASASWAAGPKAQPCAEAVGEVRLTGELRFLRHIDPVTGSGAVSLRSGDKEFSLDLRQFALDILLQPGTYELKGHWGKQGRFVVTEARRTKGRAAARPS